jgi:hypothetical protein
MSRPVGALLSSVLLGAVVMAASGCGVYSAQSGRVEEGRKLVHVEFLENNTPEPNLGVDLTDLIIQAIQTDNTLRVVSEPEADTIISGRASRYDLREVAVTSELTVNEFQVQIAVVLTMTVRATGEKVFDKKRFTGTGNFSLEDPETDEDTARIVAAEEIVRDILAMVVSDW